MASGFTLVNRQGTTDLIREFILKASTQFNAGDALIFTAGALAQASSQTNKIDGILNGVKTDKTLLRPATAFLTTTLGEIGEYIPAQTTGLIFRTRLTSPDTPLINGVACAVADANTTKTQILLTTAGSTDDATGGTIFANGEQRTIVSDTVNTGQHTYVLSAATSRAITTGDKVYVNTFGVGAKVKLSNSAKYAGVGTAVADKSSGFCYVVAVNLDPNAPGGPYADVQFMPA